MYVVALFLAAFFIFASSIKIFGWQKMIFETQMAMMENYGLTRHQFRLIGCVEMLGAVALFFTGGIIGVFGAALLMGVSLGALSFHFRFDTWQQGIPAMVTLTVASLLVLTHLDVVSTFLTSLTGA
jgi:hypothetical protein